MGKRDRGKRHIHEEDMADIAEAVGIACDEEECCPDDEEVDYFYDLDEGDVATGYAFATTSGNEMTSLFGGIVSILAGPEERIRESENGRVRSPEHYELLKKEIGQQFEKYMKGDRAKFEPDCDPTEHRTNVYNRLLVADCDNITDEEKKAMSDQLIAKGERSSNAVCSLNPECPIGRLVSYKFDRIVCENRLWEVDLTWFFTCNRS